MSYLREAREVWLTHLMSLKRFAPDPENPQYQFESILVELADLREMKAGERGESPHLFIPASDARGIQRSKLGLWADLNRKWERVDRYLFDGKGGTVNLEDDFKDIANYGAKGVQLMRRQNWR